MKKTLFLILFMSFLCGCSSQKYNFTYVDVFDTYSTLTIYSSNYKDSKAISDDLHTELLKLNKLFDIYNNYKDLNNLKTVNDNAGLQPVKVDKNIIELLKAGKEAYYITEGTVNIAMGSVLEIWHNYRENALNNGIVKIPSLNELQKANKHTDINSIIIDEKESTVYIKDKYTSIDVGAIAKGYSADFAADYLKNRGVTAALLNLGGNVICINDNKKKNWKIGITSPEKPDEYTDKIIISNQSAVSSGNYQRYYEYNGKRYHHIIDSSTLYPSVSNKGVTVVSDSSLKGDIFSTALFILPYENGAKLADKNNIQAIWITSDGNKYKTSEFNSN